ncbi:DUF2933 domain-containing protein [Comamonadaceae bacterium G21597-S1]|nr:DUF2933 domain-containing protein [Rhodoferax sp.]MCZ4314679.1 DUF2933 domain-containing protein [Comamonadaceae bacterium G21597-S1]
MNASDHDHLPNPQGASGMKPRGLAHEEHRGARPEGSGMNRPLRTTLVMVALVGGFYLLREHWDHVAGNWIYLLLLACPLMHLFHGHGGHGGHGGRASSTAKPADREE